MLLPPLPERHASAPTMPTAQARQRHSQWMSPKLHSVAQAEARRVLWRGGWGARVKPAHISPLEDGRSVVDVAAQHILLRGGLHQVSHCTEQRRRQEAASPLASQFAGVREQAGLCCACNAGHRFLRTARERRGRGRGPAPRSPKSDQWPKSCSSRSLRLPGASVPPGGSQWKAYLQGRAGCVGCGVGQVHSVSGHAVWQEGVAGRGRATHGWGRYHAKQSPPPGAKPRSAVAGGRGGVCSHSPLRLALPHVAADEVLVLA